jgi:hypothetical protein
VPFFTLKNNLQRPLPTSHLFGSFLQQKSIATKDQVTMKTTLAFLFAAAATTNGFVIPNFGVVRRSSTARAARVDTSALIEEALKTTATFGINSKEAQVAWDIIEEMDASDNR